MYGRTAAEAVEAGECLRCCRKVTDMRSWAFVDHDEYMISGFCPECWTAVMEPAS